MSKRIFCDWGVEVFKDWLGYRVRYNKGDHAGTIMNTRISASDAKRITSGVEGAKEVIDRIT